MKRQQFEDAHNCILRPRELEKLRQQLLEELELPTREVMKDLHDEVENATQGYALAVSDLRTLRSQYDIEVARLLGENESLRRDHSTELHILQRESRIMEENYRMRTQEMTDMQAQLRDRALVPTHDYALSTQSNLRKQAVRAAEKAEEELKIQISMTEQLERRLGTAVARVLEREEHIKRLTSALSEAESHKITLLRKVETDQRKHLEEVKHVTAQANLKITQLEARSNVDRVEAANVHRSLSLRLTSREECLKNIQDECDGRAYSAEASARSAHQSAKASKLESNLKLDAAMTELAACQSDLLKATGESAGLRRALRVMGKESENMVPTLELLECCKAVRAQYLLFIAFRKSVDVSFSYSFVATRFQDLRREQLRVVELSNVLQLEKTRKSEAEATISARDCELRELTIVLEQCKISYAEQIRSMKHRWYRDRSSFSIRLKRIAVIGETRRRATSRKAKQKILSQQRRILPFSSDLLLADLDGGPSKLRQWINDDTTNSVMLPAPMEFEKELAALEKKQLQYVQRIQSSLK